MGRYVRLPAPILKVISVGLRGWWKIRKPTTFGVKVLLLHPDDPTRCLIVRHSYADRTRWGLPGGAYKPGRESPEQAGAREVREELRLAVTGKPAVLETIETASEGKRDTLTIMRATAASAAFTLAPELAEARWVDAEPGAMPQDEPVSRWLTRALQATRAAALPNVGDTSAAPGRRRADGRGQHDRHTR